MSLKQDILAFLEGAATFIGTTIVSKLFGQKVGLALGILNVIKDLYTQYGPDFNLSQGGNNLAITSFADKVVDSYVNIETIYKDLDSIEAALRTLVPETTLERAYVNGALDVIMELRKRI